MEKITLMPHQERMAEWLLARRGRGLLWADAGTGKTFTALSALQRLGAGGTLILCPASLKDQWESEAARFYGPGVAVAIKGNAEERAKLWMNDALIKIANYDLLNEERDFMLMTSMLWDAVVADECHMINSPAAKRSKRFKKLKPAFRIALSGTPIPNALHEIWNVADWVEPGALGKSFWSFKKSSCIEDWFGGITGYHNEEWIWSVVRRISHRVERAEAGELPELKNGDRPRASR